jgi:hypothetical protein
VPFFRRADDFAIVIVRIPIYDAIAHLPDAPAPAVRRRVSNGFHPSRGVQR